MLLVLFSWVIIFTIFYLWGISVSKLISLLSPGNENNEQFGIDEYFFIGFFSISLITGILSIWLPMGRIVLVSICLFSGLFIFVFKEKVSCLLKLYKSRSKYELVFMLLLIWLVLTAVVSRITFEDTLTYHSQNIQWIQKYAVVPGLGNIHGRFAFNNMFFVISSVFSFKIKQSIIYPLNGVCYVVLGLKLLNLSIKEFNSGFKWKSTFYILLLLISLLILFPNLNTPAPDIICNILIIYAFVIIFQQYESDDSKLSLVKYVLINLLIFSCVTYKISSIFLLPAFLFFLRSDILKKIIVTTVIGSLILIPFLVRNFYLSGYIIYPFPGLDIFNVDWKIPFADVAATKLEIESFAKIKGIAYDIVRDMPLKDWIFQWFHARDFNTKFIVFVNLLSLFSLIILFIKKELFLAMMSILIFINLTFWLSTAPDPRFAYGFLIAGFALTFAYFIKMVESSKHSDILRFLRIIFIGVFLIIISQRISFPLDTIKHASLWVFPASMPKVEVVTYNTNFEYRVPAKDGEWCYNTEIPCVTYSLDNIVMRGNDFQDGFKLKVNP